MKKTAWKSDSCDGALLFLLLHKRIKGHPDNFSSSELQDDPLLGFDEHSTYSKTFKRNSQTIANRVKKIEAKGAGLTSEFKTFLRQVKADRLESFSTGKKTKRRSLTKTASMTTKTTCPVSHRLKTRNL